MSLQGKRLPKEKETSIVLAGRVKALRLKKLFNLKILRLLALGFIFLASILLLLQGYYGKTELVAVGKIRFAEGKTVFMDVIASSPGMRSETVTVHLSRMLAQSILRDGETEFLAVLNRRGNGLYFERLFELEAPEDSKLLGPQTPGWQTLAIGTKPELVAMVGLDRYGYQLKQPAWAKRLIPEADRLYYQRGTFDSVKAVLDGDEYQPNLFILDGNSRVVGLRKIGRAHLTLPRFFRLAAAALFCLGFLLGAVILVLYKRTILVSFGRRIWDHVSRRGRKASI